MRRDEGDRERSAVRNPHLAGAVARALAGTALAWAIRPILGLLAIAVAVGLFAAWGIVIVAIGLIAGALGLTSGGAVATPVILGALIVSTVLMVRPTRWAVRNLLRAEGTLEDAADRLANGTSAPVSRADAATPRASGITSEELAALDARLAAAPSDAGQGVPEQPDR